MSDDEFWRLTPREFHALQKQFQQHMRIENYRFGIMPSMYFNAHKRRTQSPLKPLDFFAERKPMQTAEQIGRMLSRLDTHFRGKRGELG